MDTEKIEGLIKRSLWDTKLAKDDQIAFMARETMDGMVVKIWYRSVGDENKLVKYEVVTSEAWDWEKAGVTNNEDWRAYLNKLLWRDYACGLSEN